MPSHTSRAAILIACAASAHALPSVRPNIIFILADDLGYGDVQISKQVNGSSFRIPTPNIDRLAQNGMKFSRGYSGQVCAPSRCMLMTGRHLGHCTIRGNDGSYSPLLPSDETVAATLRKAGYRTGLVGKWGLGDYNTSGYPLDQGFDFYIGQDSQVGCHDWYPIAINNQSEQNFPLNDKSALNYKQCLGSDSKCKWANNVDKDVAVDFIRSSAQPSQGSDESEAERKPFFLYLSTTTPHTGSLGGSGERPDFFSAEYPVPYPYNQKFLDQTGEWNNADKQFAAAVWAQDVIVGAVLDEIESLGIEKETVVFFSGDNGPDGPNLALFDDPGPFRGKKRSLHEGGIRQTIVVQWPGVIAAGSTSEDMFVFYDLLPTAANLAKLDRSEWPVTDGVSAVPIFSSSRQGKHFKTHPDVHPDAQGRYLYWEFCHYGNVNGLLPQVYDDGWIQAVRWDDNETEYPTQWKAIASNMDYDGVLLYNITEDQSESRPINVDSSAAAKRAWNLILEIMKTDRTENEFWKSSRNKTDKCCNSCFKHQGCPAPCKQIATTPDEQDTVASVAISELLGAWETVGHRGPLRVSADAAQGLTVSGLGGSAARFHFNPGNQSLILAVDSVTEPPIVGQVLRSKSALYVVDVDYTYADETLEIQWSRAIPTAAGDLPAKWTRVVRRMVIQ